MTRRWINRLLIFGFLIIGIVKSSAQDERPNVLLILTDDQGSIDMNAYGAEDLFTPSMDRLAREGVRFTQFYAAAAVCSPSRAALLTGKTNLRAGLPGNVPVPEYAKEKGKYGMPTQQVTMAEILKERGYYTALVGKWHLGHQPETLPNGQGFDYFFGHQRGCIDNYSHFFFWQGPNKHDLYRNAQEVHYPGQHFSDLMVSEIKQIIQEEREDPFFIYWAFNAPHYPYQGGSKWMEYYKDLPSPRREYAAFVSNIDEKIGEVLHELDRQGLTENTIVIFQSDHGHSREERAFWGGGDSGPYRGCKFSLFEGGIRVPAMIRYPAVIPAGQVRDQPCMEMDWYATVAQLTGASSTGEALDGRSLMPIIENAAAPSLHDVMYWQYGSYERDRAQWAVRQGPWKLMGNVRDPSDGQREGVVYPQFLSNLEQDPSEQTDLAAKHPDVVDRLRKLHQQWLGSVQEEMKSQINVSKP